MAPPKTKSTKKVSEAGTERLDVEEDDARQKRLQSLLEHLSAPTSNPAATTTPAFPAPPTGLPKFDFGDRRTEAVVPNTELLSRVQAFLPQLEASNRELLARAKTDPKSVDIENVNDKGGRVIEMNLGLGVFEPKGGRKSGKLGKKNAADTSAGAAPSIKTGGNEDDEAMDSSSSSSSSSDDSDSDSSDDSDSDSTSSSSTSTSSSSSSSEAEDEGPNDPLTNFFASLGSALDSATSPSSQSDSHSDSEEEDGDGDPLMTFFDSLRYGQTISMDSSDEGEDEGGEEGGGASGDGESDEEGGSRTEGRPTKPLPKRARPRIEVIGDEAPVDDVKRGAGEA